MKKVFISDLDHTLLRDDATLSTFTQEHWNAAAGEHILSVATARSFYSVSRLLKDFHINAPMILLDGALIVSPEHQCLHAVTMEEELLNLLIDEAVAFADLHPFVIGLKGEGLDESFDFPMQTTRVQSILLKKYQDDARLQQHRHIRARKETFKVVYMGSKEEMIPLYEHLRLRFGTAFEFKISPENYSGGYFLTILHPEADKSHGLKRLSEHLQIDLREFTVFGDSINDIGMFKLAGTSIAVSNALDETKAHADIILNKTNDEDGIAHYLSQLREN